MAQAEACDSRVKKTIPITILVILLQSCCTQFARKHEPRSYLLIDFDTFTSKPCEYIGHNIVLECYYMYSMHFAFKNQQTHINQATYTLKDERWKQVIQVLPHKCMQRKQYPHLRKGLYRIYGKGIMEEIVCDKKSIYGGYIEAHRIELIETY